MTLLDGRTSAYQWDIDIYAIIPNANVGDEVQFSNNGQTALVVKAVEKEGQIVAPVPNCMLQCFSPISVYRFIYTENGDYTVWREKLRVLPKPKPDDYIFTQTEVLTWEALDKRLTALEEGGAVDKFYTFTQMTPADQWQITHNLDKYPSVSIVDSAGSLVVGEVRYLSQNTLTVSFQSAFSGKAYLN